MFSGGEKKYLYESSGRRVGHARRILEPMANTTARYNIGAAFLILILRLIIAKQSKNGSCRAVVLTSDINRVRVEKCVVGIFGQGTRGVEPHPTGDAGNWSRRNGMHSILYRDVVGRMLMGLAMRAKARRAQPGLIVGGPKAINPSGKVWPWLPRCRQSSSPRETTRTPNIVAAAA